MRLRSSKTGGGWWPARRLPLLIGLVGGLVLGAGAVTWAAGPLKVWNPGEALKSADLNANFAALAAGQTPSQVVAGFNTAVGAGATVTLGAIAPAATQYDLRWMTMHAAAAGACAAASPPGDSADGHIVLVKPAGATCTSACMANSGGVYTNCRTAIAVGSVLPTQAHTYTDVIANNYNYGCMDSQSGYDEVTGQGLSSSYVEYCCCYH